MNRYLFLFMICITTAASADSTIGRLFSTPAERSNLDYLRQTSRVKLLEDKSGEPAEEVPELPSAVSMQGYVRRSDGQKSTVWVNNKPMQEDTSSSEVQVGKLSPKSNMVPIVIPGNGRVVGLKAGQVYVPDTDKIEEINAHARAKAKEKSEELMPPDADEGDEEITTKKPLKNKVTETSR